MSSVTVDFLSPDEKLLANIVSAEQFLAEASHTYEDDGSLVYGEGVRNYALARLGKAMMEAVIGETAFDHTVELYERNADLYAEAMQQAQIFYGGTN
jgi:hypothetical protein